MSITKIFSEQETLSLLNQEKENLDKDICCYKDVAWKIELITGLTSTGILIEDRRRMHIQGYLHNKNNAPAEIIVEGAYHPDISRIGKALCEKIIDRKRNYEIGKKISQDAFIQAKSIKEELESILKYSN